MPTLPEAIANLPPSRSVYPSARPPQAQPAPAPLPPPSRKRATWSPDPSELVPVAPLRAPTAPASYFAAAPPAFVPYGSVLAASSLYAAAGYVPQQAIPLNAPVGPSATTNAYVPTKGVDAQALRSSAARYEYAQSTSHVSG
ncbi:hypothetical protein JCM10212_000475 [Sporobolomyces blumeae]